MGQPEIWGGIECTVNRVGERFHSQFNFSGHDVRRTDLNEISELGIRTLRYPVLWEQVAPNSPAEFDWTWHDERLASIKAHGITPIIGLLHHGSGPAYTNLLDLEFESQFAVYAEAVARRYPWVKHFTPINEPLTTARFSALYGYWYPHKCSDRDFVRALLNQCKATCLAMRTIRRATPLAQLVQTEDFGKVYSTRHLAYQAVFENYRRWLTWDLLCGSVDRTHPMRRYLTDSGATDAELDWFTANPCPPDVIGINHYLTSNRYLHQEESWCPRDRWGGNAREAYADTEAVRVLSDPAEDIGSLLHEVWERYRIPIAITETHLGCTREEQIRWLHYVWESAVKTQSEGVDIRAVTVWALLGSFDWNSLLTKFTGHYEPGALDVRSPKPRRTAIATLVRTLASGDRSKLQSFMEALPPAETPGWWDRPSRFVAGCSGVPNGPMIVSAKRKRVRPLLITGARGTLGSAFARICEHRDLQYRSCLRCDLDISAGESIERMLKELNPWAVINAAGYVRVDDAERDSERCFRENLHGAEALAVAAAARNIPLLTFSTDLVFDGSAVNPYVESHLAAPLNVYGRSKALAEQAVLSRHPDALVIRTSSFFGPWDEHNFLALLIRSLRSGQAFTAIDDVIVSPTFVPDLVNASLDLLIDGEKGLWHLTNRGALSWAELAQQFAAIANMDRNRISPASWRSVGFIAQRPRYSALASERGSIMPSLENALERFAASVAHTG